MPDCRNCSAPLTGPFCAECGQSDTGRLTMRGFFRHAAGRMFSMDRGFLRTLVDMFREPGDVPRRYVEGRRAWYTNPLSYWLVAAAIQLIALNFIEDGYLTYLQGQLRSQMEMMGETGQKSMESYSELWQVEDPIPQLAQVMLRSVKAAYSYMGLFFAFAMALALNLFMRRRSGGYNLAEQFVFSLFVIGHWTLFTGLILPITFRISPVLHSTIGVGGYFVIFAVASLGFHQEGARGVLKTSLSLVLAFLAYMLILSMVMIVFVATSAFEAAKLAG